MGRFGVLGLVSVLLAGCAPDPDAPRTPSPGTPGGSSSAVPTTPVVPTSTASTRTPSPTATSTPAGPSCADLAAGLSPAEQVGQLLMVAVPSTGLGSGDRAVLADSRAGSVILLGNSTAGAVATRWVVRAVREATPRPEGIRTLLAVDQEGGQVQRLRGPGFADIPSAEQQAERSDDRLAADAERWGRELAEVGIDADLAPVADVVPDDLGRANAPIGRLRRGYGSSPRKVAAKTIAFVAGMDRAGVATAVKHFPGLGRVRGNTDFARRVVDSVTTRDDPAVTPFAATIRADVDLVMVSSAFYTRIDPERRAAFSPVVLRDMLRDDLGFPGVVISDDLAAAAMADVPPAQRALRFLGAGGDLMIVGDPQLVAPMTRAVRQRVADDPDFAEQVRRSAERVLALKARRGLATCG